MLRLYRVSCDERWDDRPFEYVSSLFIRLNICSNRSNSKCFSSYFKSFQLNKLNIRFMKLPDSTWFVTLVNNFSYLSKKMFNLFKCILHLVFVSVLLVLCTHSSPRANYHPLQGGYAIAYLALDHFLVRFFAFFGPIVFSAFRAF